ncbi:esterase 6-like [Episyrphus balteatus]|uniref:esterase 6-like n=1 Tax=Episyrphus balteatus TaxID=286459 RepID=UPI002485627F|nr:esterase 6-like [Episyrphus balteatus]
MYSFKVVSLTLLIFELILSFSNATDGRIVDLPNGQMQGSLIENYYSFTNIRYAEPPVRFEPSKPYESNWEGIQNATGEMLACVQFERFANFTKGQEDCLFLNIFTPQKADNNNLLPVFIYIHGGAFMYGSAAFYSPKIIMEEGNMIVVTINYRLGPLGFLSTEDGAIPGNLGLKDQQLALRWIKKNIHLFGGDPEKILLTGESAGGASVHFHVLQIETENLVSAAAGRSGCALNPWVMQKNPREKTETLAKLLNCPSEGKELKCCLKEKPIDKIYAAVGKMFKFLDNPFNLFGPVVEKENTPGAFMTAEPRRLIQRGEIANIPYMVSMTSEEGAYNAAFFLSKNKNGVEYIDELNERWFELAPYLLFYYDEPCKECKQKLSESLKEMYMGKERISRKSYLKLQKMFSDLIFINGILETIKLHRMFGPRPVYSYIYANPHKYGVGNFFANDLEFEFGATHGDDEALYLPFIPFAQFENATNLTNMKISKYFLKMFETFVSEGIPLFKDTSLPANENNLEPIKYLQIFGEKYCIGPWMSNKTQECQQSETCFSY